MRTVTTKLTFRHYIAFKVNPTALFNFSRSTLQLYSPLFRTRLCFPTGCEGSTAEHLPAPVFSEREVQMTESIS